MRESVRLPGYQFFRIFSDAAVRVGVYSGAALSLVLTGWVVLANRLPALEPFAMQRNATAMIIFCLAAALPILRFCRSPWDLLESGLIAWTLVSTTFCLLTFAFVRLNADYGRFHVLVIGTVSYLVFATLSWIGSIIRRARTADASQH